MSSRELLGVTPWLQAHSTRMARSVRLDDAITSYCADYMMELYPEPHGVKLRSPAETAARKMRKNTRTPEGLRLPRVVRRLAPLTEATWSASPRRCFLTREGVTGGPQGAGVLICGWKPALVLGRGRHGCWRSRRDRLAAEGPGFVLQHQEPLERPRACRSISALHALAPWPRRPDIEKR